MSRVLLLVGCLGCSQATNLLPATDGQKSEIEVERFARRPMR
jgi:hypothetical protein